MSATPRTYYRQFHDQMIALFEELRHGQFTDTWLPDWWLWSDSPIRQYADDRQRGLTGSNRVAFDAPAWSTRDAVESMFTGQHHVMAYRRYPLRRRAFFMNCPQDFSGTVGLPPLLSLEPYRKTKYILVKHRLSKSFWSRRTEWDTRLSQCVQQDLLLPRLMRSRQLSG